MPPKRTRAARAENSTTPEADAESKLAALLEELDVEVESRCQMLQSDADRMASWVRSEYKMLLEKLPKKVRGMKVADFFAQNGSEASELAVPELQALAAKYQASENNSEPAADESTRTPFKVVSNPNGSTTVLRSTRGAKSTSVLKSAAKRPVPAEQDEGGPRTTRRTTRAQSIVAATPAQSKAGGIVAQTPAFAAGLPFTPAHHSQGIQPMGTCLRLPKRGESIISTSGAAIGTFESDATAQMFLDDQAKIAAFAMSTGAGEETVNVADPQVCAALPKDVRLKAAKNVLAMQQQLEAMLANLR